MHNSTSGRKIFLVKSQSAVVNSFFLTFFFLILFSEQEAWRPSDIAIDNQAAHDQPTVFGAKNKLQQEILTPLQDEVCTYFRSVYKIF